MDAKCPFCTSEFQTDLPGPQPCPHCGSQVNVQPKDTAAPPSGPPSEAPSPGPGPGPRFEDLPPRAVQEVPWERQTELGILRAFGQTVLLSVTQPETFFAGVRPNGPFLPALLYAWIIAAIGASLSVPLRLLQIRRWEPEDLERLPPAVQEFVQKVIETMGSVPGAIGTALGGLLFFPVALLMTAGVVHLCCLLWGTGRGGFTATFRTLCYCTGPNVLAFVPCVNVLLGLYVWVLLVVGIKQVHQSSYGKATGAVLTPLLVGCCCFGALLGALGMAIGAAMRSSA